MLLMPALRLQAQITGTIRLQRDLLRHLPDCQPPNLKLYLLIQHALKNENKTHSPRGDTGKSVLTR